MKSDLCIENTPKKEYFCQSPDKVINFIGVQYKSLPPKLQNYSHLKKSTDCIRSIHIFYKYYKGIHFHCQTVITFL